MNQVLVLAVTAGIIYWLGSVMVGYNMMEGFTWFPLMHAVIYGLITGQMKCNEIFLNLNVSE